MGRWLTDKPKVYILDEPTRGIDVQAKTEIYAQIGRLANRGAAVVVISSELPEVIGISHRILVMRLGRLVGEVDAAVATEHGLLQLAMVDEFLFPPREAVELQPVRGPVVVAPITGTSISLPYSSSVPLEAGPIGDPNKTYTFAFSQALLGSSWAVAQKESVMLEAARHPNVNVIYYNTDNDAREQVRNIEECVAKKVDAIMVWPAAVGPLTLAVEEAEQKGIVIVGMERNIATRSYDTWIWLDFPRAAGALAEKIAKHLNGKGVVAEVPGSFGSSPAILRHDGFMKAIRQYPGIKVIPTRATNWTEPEGYQVALQFLQSGKRPDAWYVHYSEIGRGVWRAMTEFGRADIPIFTIVDGRQSVRDVQEGKFLAVAPWTPLHGDLAFRVAAYHVTGKTVPKDIILAQPPLITSENAGDWVRRTWED